MTTITVQADPDYIDDRATAVVQAALPAPRRVDAGKVYVVGENQQVAFRFPIVVEGVLRVDGILYEV